MYTKTAFALLLGCAALLANGPAISQTSLICPTAGASGDYRSEQGCFKKHTSHIVPAEIDQRPQDIQLVLAAKQVNALNALIAEVQQLRKELATNTAKLEDARKAYDLANAKAVTWKKDALESVLADIRSMPAALAGNSELRRALVPAVASDLVADKAFLDAVHGAGGVPQAQSNKTHP